MKSRKKSSVYWIKEKEDPFCVTVQGLARLEKTDGVD